MFKVLSTGPQALFQDTGRAGFMSSGVSPSGAFDRRSAASATRALGNEPFTPVVEILYGGFSVEALAAATIVFTGCRAPVILNGTQLYSHTLIDVQPGDRLTLAPAQQGLRSYFAVSGGFDLTPVLGSTSRDTLSNIGPAPIKEGDILYVGSAAASYDWYPLSRSLTPVWAFTPTTTLDVISGPRHDWFRCLEQFYDGTFEVSSESNRIGVRLIADTPLERAVTDELPSEGMVRGSIQVPPSGHPVMFGPDHPVTGGYPVIAVLTDEACDRASQLAPGDRVRFRRVFSSPPPAEMCSPCDL